MLRYRSALRNARERRLRGEPGPRERSVRPITIEEMREAEREIVKSVQQQSFAIEVAAIRKKESSVAEKDATYLQA